MARHARRLIVWTTVVLLSLAVLAMLGIALLVWGIDPDMFRARIERAATQAIGRRVELTGGLRWRPGLNFQIESRGGRIANAEGFGAAPLASWESLRLDVALRPLLDHRLQVDQLEVLGLQLNLLRGPRGVNWSLPPSSAAPKETGLSLELGHIALRDGAIRYADEVSGNSWSATALAFDVRLPAKLDADPLTFSDMSLQARLDGAPLQTAGVMVAMSAPRLDVDRAHARVQVPQWQLKWNESGFSGTVDATVGDRLEAKAEVRIEAPSLRLLMQSFSVDPPATRDASVLGPLRLKAQVALGAGHLAVTQLEATLDATRVEGVVVLAKFAPVSLRFDLSADLVDVDRYLTPQDQPGTPLTLPLAQLKALDAKGVLTLRRASLAGAAAREMRIDVD
jgi:AsmA protein